MLVGPRTSMADECHGHSESDRIAIARGQHGQFVNRSVRNDPVADPNDLAQNDAMRHVTACFAFVAAVSAFSSTANSQAVAEGREAFASEGEIFAEVYANPVRLEQIENEVSTKGWLLDCAAAATAQRFIRVQLPSNAALDPDIRYFVDLPNVSKVQMVYQTMPKTPCIAKP